jgi:nucleoside-diphosphate-sugar epimerase
MIKVCIFGASGFVGRALTERLLSHHDIEVKAIIHNSANSSPVLRLGIPLYHADQTDITSIDKVVQGCTHIVNCALVPDNQLIKSIENLIISCRNHDIKRLVHLSSITVYGEQPHPESSSESGPILAKRKTYGWYKSRQDELLFKANQSGLSTVVLCPPHVTGPYGRIFHQVIDGIKKGTFALVEDGNMPCNLVDVNNLCNAIELALFARESDGRRIFITNDDDYKWSDLAEKAAELANINYNEIPRITSAQAQVLNGKHITLRGFVKSVLKLKEVKDLASQTVLKRNDTIYNFIKIIYRLLGLNRLSLDYPSGDEVQSKKSILQNLDPWLCKQQLRGVRHKNERALSLLGYKSVMDSRMSFKLFEDYYSELHGYNSVYWKLQELIND